MADSRAKNSAKNATINIISRVCSILCSFVIRTVFLKYLGEQYTGVSTLFTDILNILSFTELGIGTAISFAFYKPVATDDKKRIAELMHLCKYIYTAIALAVLIIGILLVPALGLFVKDVPDINENITYIYILYVIKTAASYLLIYKSTLLIAKQKQYIVTGVESICTVTKTGIDFLVLVTTKNFLLYLYMEITRVVISNLIISRLSDKELKDNEYYRKVRIRLADFKGLFSNVKDVFIYKVNGIILTSTDSLVISTIINTSAVTYMSNYNLIFNAVNNIAYQAISAVTASVGNLAVLKTNKEQKNVFYTMNLMCFMFTCIATVGLWLCTNPFIELIWGSKYVLSESIVLLLCVNLFIVNMHMIVDMFRTANGIFREGRMRPLATAVINLIVSIVAAKYLGLQGVLLGTVVARASTQLWYDSKLVFNLVFKSSVKGYYLKYALYGVIVFLYCIIGTILLNTVETPISRFVAGFGFALIFVSGMNVLLFFRTGAFKSAFQYVILIFKRG